MFKDQGIKTLKEHKYYDPRDSKQIVWHLWRLACNMENFTNVSSVLKNSNTERSSYRNLEIALCPTGSILVLMLVNIRVCDLRSQQASEMV